MNKTLHHQFPLDINDLKKFFIRYAWFIVVFSTSITVMAGDSAKLDVIGFSPDSNYFAFEQYGIQASSGFPYSEIFIIDTLTDSWVEKSPFRILDQDTNTWLSKTRGKNKQRGLPLLTQLNIAQPAHSITDKDGSGYKSDDPRLSVALQPISSNQSSSPAPRMLLEQWEIEAPHCKRRNIRPKLFRLLLETGVNDTFILLHEDKRLPKSRGCPINYSINDVFAPSGRNDETETIAVLVNVSQQGSKGSDKRIMAITSKIDAIW